MPQETVPAANKPDLRETPAVRAWQKRLLPVMVSMVVVLAFFFFSASMVQLYNLQNRIAHGPDLNLVSELEKMAVANDPSKSESLLKLQRWKTLTRLEVHTIKQRYHQANVLLMARVWVQYLGFVTGMILSLVGAVFVLGKIREDKTSLGIEQKGLKGTLTTTSPGLVLVFLGVTLMITTLVTHHQIGVNDGPLYVVLPYAKIKQEGIVEERPEDVMNLKSRQPTKSGPAGASQASKNQAQENLDKLADEIEATSKKPTK